MVGTHTRMISFSFKSSGLANASASDSKDALPRPTLHSWKRRRMSSSGGITWLREEVRVLCGRVYFYISSGEHDSSSLTYRSRARWRSIGWLMRFVIHMPWCRRAEHCITSVHWNTVVGLVCRLHFLPQWTEGSLFATCKVHVTNVCCESANTTYLVSSRTPRRPRLQAAVP